MSNLGKRVSPDRGGQCVLFLGWSLLMFSCQGPAGPGGSGRCESLGENESCLALRFVSYQDPTGRPVVNQDEAKQTVAGINSVWAGCGIQFTLESYELVAPNDFGVAFNPSQFFELDLIRSRFVQDQSLLIVASGPWAQGSQLQAYGANAWSTGPFLQSPGIVVEQAMAHYANLIAHELGHSLNLPHLSDAMDLMNPVVFPNSTRLYEQQCEVAQDSLTEHWGAALRG